MAFNLSFSDALAQQQQPQQRNPFGTSAEGARASGLTPLYLKQAAGSGQQMADWFAQAWQQLGDKRGINTQMAAMQQQGQESARRARTASKFKGSPIGEALAQSALQGAQAAQTQASIADEAQRLRGGMALSQAYTGAVTSPLLSVLGISMGDAQAQAALAEQRRQFDRSQPSTFDKILGFVGGVLCWVAREVLGDDRWLAARAYMLNEAPDYTRRLYEEYGEELAARVAREPELRQELTPVFEEFARRGAKYVE